MSNPTGRSLKNAARVVICLQLARLTIMLNLKANDLKLRS